MNIKGLSEFFNKLTNLDRFLIAVLILGLGLMSIGLFKGIVEDSQVQVEVIKRETTSETDKKLIIDVGGAVTTPGVYELPQNSRIKDALIIAGGLSEKADRDYVQKNINLAEIIKDGQKIFIPFIGKSGQVAGYVEANSELDKININTATLQDLDTLKGIGATRAKSIIDGRPYKSVEDLVTKKIVSQSILDSIKDRLIAY